MFVRRNEYVKKHRRMLITVAAGVLSLAVALPAAACGGSDNGRWQSGTSREKRASSAYGEKTQKSQKDRKHRKDRKNRKNQTHSGYKRETTDANQSKDREAPKAGDEVTTKPTTSGSDTTTAKPSTPATQKPATGPATNSGNDDTSAEAVVKVGSATPKVTPTTKALPTATGSSASTPSATSNVGATQTVYFTGYGYPDNDPPGSAAIALPSIHQRAGGTGTYADPITVAVKKGGAYQPGQRFYFPELKKYGIVEDWCASCSATQLDLWVGGDGSNDSQVLACESTITGNHPVVIDPKEGLPTESGDIATSSACAK